MTLGAGILGFSLKGDLSQLPNNISTGSYFTPEIANIPTLPIHLYGYFISNERLVQLVDGMPENTRARQAFLIRIEHYFSHNKTIFS